VHIGALPSQKIAWLSTGDKAMYPDIEWDREPNLDELRTAYELLATNGSAGRAKLEELADRGSIASMWYLADAYSSGRFFAKDLEKAKTWYIRAEANGWIPASYNLGREYYTLKDYNAAFEAFSRGAAKNYVPAAYRLAMMYWKGLGTRKDINECRNLLNIAASKGHLFAKRALALLYISGSLGVLKIHYGAWMLTSLAFDLVKISITREFKNPGFDDRTLA
jgi:TPR repeat protein